MEKKLIIFIDSGDTLVDESTEIFDAEGVVLKAELRPGAHELIKTLKSEGYKVYMVADGLEQSFMNVHVANGIFDDFDGHIFSERVGTWKPDAKMFDSALLEAGLTREDCSRVMMVGNNLERDVKGANAMGMISVHMAWSDRYPKTGKDETEIPDYVINEPLELLALASDINKTL